MAEAYLKGTKLKLVFDYGMDDENKPVYKSKTFNNVRRNANSDELFQAAQAIGTLSMNPLWEIERNDSFNIDE
ncbi:DUF1659 domain-containing protein [Bacillus sp. FSL K6-3431]|uniref:DUF1659 domain-containing protein n=1 Tax=Bacillus sp. FSL K6-3431 TaxID=2921500 RepID=UPI0030F93902